LLEWPNTVLILGTTGLPDASGPESGFSMKYSGINPVSDQGSISIYVPIPDRCEIRISDLPGRQQLLFDQWVEAGSHTFIIRPGYGHYLVLSASWRHQVTSLKMINTSPNTSAPCEINYTGKTEILQSIPKAGGMLMISAGDLLLLEAYANTSYHGMIDTAQNNGTYVFQFNTPGLCPAWPVIDYGGEIYPTVQIGTQCWMAKNLNIGTFVTSINTGSSHSDVSNNGIIEKYCSNNDPNNCAVYGGLYDWDEVMDYDSIAGA
jgi:hypothetical protein